MKTEEYYAYRDNLLKEINDTLERVDNDSKKELDRITHEAIYAINKWRIKYHLTRYKEFNILELLEPDKSIDVSEFKLEFMQNGMFRIIYKDLRSEWASYKGIAMIAIENNEYIAVTEYYSDIKSETIFQISKIKRIPVEKILEYKPENEGK